MTAEIAVLNKFGVALAADSAITVDHFIDGEIKTKVYNTANKLFSLSKYHPVGVMFYNTVTLGGIPWETIIKCYRKHLGRKSFPHLQDYANDFFSYLNSSPKLFAEENVRDIVESNFFQQLGEIRHRCKNKIEFIQKLDSRLAEYEAADYINGFDEVFGEETVKDYENESKTAMEYMISKKSYLIGQKSKIDRLFALMLTKKLRMRGYSGIVFAGFGEQESLPSLFEYYTDIMVKDKIGHWRLRRKQISNEHPSEVVPLADSEAIKTLIEGINPSYRDEMMGGLLSLLRSLPAAIIDPIAEIDEQQKKKYVDAARRAIPRSFRKFSEDMAKVRNKTYTVPINLPISSLPIGELGTVAEAFLGASQVLKKVNPDLETVGGPVDIAVISKGDGFVWIKRKHYFDETLNPAFKLKYLEQ